MKEIKIGFIGLGARGYGLMKYVVLEQGEQVTAVCDVYEDRAVSGADVVEESGQARPAVYLDYHEIFVGLLLSVPFFLFVMPEYSYILFSLLFFVFLIFSVSIF